MTKKAHDPTKAVYVKKTDITCPLTVIIRDASATGAIKLFNKS